MFWGGGALVKLHAVLASTLRGGGVRAPAGTQLAKDPPPPATRTLALFTWGAWSKLLCTYQTLRLNHCFIREITRWIKKGVKQKQKSDDSLINIPRADLIVCLHVFFVNETIPKPQHKKKKTDIKHTWFKCTVLRASPWFMTLFFFPFGHQPIIDMKRKRNWAENLEARRQMMYRSLYSLYAKFSSQINYSEGGKGVLEKQRRERTRAAFSHSLEKHSRVVAGQTGATKKTTKKCCFKRKYWRWVPILCKQWRDCSSAKAGTCSNTKDGRGWRLNPPSLGFNVCRQHWVRASTAETAADDRRRW